MSFEINLIMGVHHFAMNYRIYNGFEVNRLCVFLCAFGFLRIFLSFWQSLNRFSTSADFFRCDNEN